MFDEFFDHEFWDLDAADFFILAGAYGYGKEECAERARIEKEAQQDQDQEEPDFSCQDCDPPTPSDEEPYP